jgi:Phosphoesterase family
MKQSSKKDAGDMMKHLFRALLLFTLVSFICALAQISSFQHVVIIVQENRTPDNLFQGLCGNNRSLCPNPYDLQNYGFNSKGQKIALVSGPLGTNYDLAHTHHAFNAMCDLNTATNECRMDGADRINCFFAPTCPPNPEFQFVQSSDVGPYLTLAQRYGWANYMFQTNQGASAPAHQFLFAGTSAPNAADDATATFVAESPIGMGCLAPLNATYNLISPLTAPKEFTLANNPLGTVCFSHATMASLLDASGRTWKYYTPGANSIWTAPNWIREICQPDANYTVCMGPTCIRREFHCFCSRLPENRYSAAKYLQQSVDFHKCNFSPPGVLIYGPDAVSPAPTFG